MPEERRLVSVLFVDIVGSTALGHDNDPEVVRSVLGRYFERTQAIAEAHGGTVEKFIGDAVMVVFGVPRLHDDDAERAVRTALAIREALGPLNDQLALRLDARSGVNSGEVVAAIDERREFLVTGDVVNVAARLQQSADPGEIVVGPLTAQLTRASIEYEPRDAIDARGKPEPITAFTAVRALSDVPDQARGLPAMRARLVGRARELRMLLDTYERARDDGQPQLFTLVGSAGVGKSRLVGEFLARISSGADERDEATILRGRCLPYGTGITWWPLMEVIQSDLAVTSAASRADVLARLDTRLDTLFADERDRVRVRGPLSVLLGLVEASDAMPDVAGPQVSAELGSAFGDYLDAIALRSPVVVVVDDLQWAEAPAIEVIRDVFTRAVDVPLVIVCIARPELLDQHGGWGSGIANSTVIVLEPLNEQETRTLIARLLDIDGMPEELRAAIVARAEGNPLYCEEFVRMLIEERRLVRRDERWVAADEHSFDVRVPESIHALIAARLDGLAPAEKSLVSAASVIGEQFEGGQVVALAEPPGALEPANPVAEPDAGPRAGRHELEGLTRRGIVVANRRAGAGAYRFRHLLIRDVAYGALPKAERARLHERFGLQLEAEAVAGGRRDELVGILTHHAERALSLSMELRMTGAAMAARARRAFGLALDAADRSIRREDVRAADAFLNAVERAAGVLGEALEPADRAAHHLLVGRVAELRPDYVLARSVLPQAAAEAEAIGRSDLAAAAYLSLAQVLTQSMGDDHELDEIDANAEAARRHFEAIGDGGGQIAAERVGLERLFEHGRLSEMLERGKRLAARAVEIGEPARAAALYARLVSTAGWLGRGDEAEALAERAIAMADELGLSATRRWARFFRARIAWMRGRMDLAERETRALVDEATRTGDGSMAITARRLLAETLMEVDRLDEADEYLAAAVEASVRTGDRWSRTELQAHRATIRVRRGDLAGARLLLAESEQTLRGGDVAAVCVVEGVRGSLAVAEGDDVEAERAFRNAVAQARGTEYWWWTTDAIDLAHFLASRGRLAEAAPIITEVDATMRRLGYGLRRERIDGLLRQVERLPA
jgi:class 3 adenylate cyclase/tetratricopeptide (TPR) repeat protein